MNSVLRIDPDAQWAARNLDTERCTGVAITPLHGVPILLKDNIDTGGSGGGSMATSAGTLALANSYAPADAPLVRHLRNAGALILGKTNMTELANYMSNCMPSGYSSLGGQVINPHHPALPVSTSSSGSAAAVAAAPLVLPFGKFTVYNCVIHSSLFGACIYTNLDPGLWLSWYVCVWCLAHVVLLLLAFCLLPFAHPTIRAPCRPCQVL